MSYKLVLIFILGLSLLGCSQESTEDNGLFSVPSSNLQQNSGNNSSNTEQETSVVPSPTINYISVYSDRVNIPVGETATLYALAYYSDGSAQNISSTGNWSSSDVSVLTTSGSTATAVSTGTAIVTIEKDGVTASTTLLPFNATADSLELNESSVSISSDGSFQAKATLFFDNGYSQIVTSEAVWSTSDSAVASVDNDGLVTAIASGSATIQADYLGFSATVNITVSAATISSIEVSPIIGSGATGQYQQFYATAIMSDGTNQDLTSIVTWNSSNSSKLEIDETGLAYLKSGGVVSVTADYGVHTKTVNFTVNAKTLQSISVALSETNPSQNITVFATCTATYSDSSIEDVTESVTWSVANGSLATISNQANKKGEIKTLSSGSTTIKASLSGIESTQTLNITSASLVSIEVTPGETFISSGIDAQFRAIGTYDDGSVVEITTDVQWTSSNTGLATISNQEGKKGYLKNLYSGSSTQTMNVTATLNGISDSAGIIIAPGTITSISVNPTMVSMKSLTSLDIKAYAHFDDGASVEITDIATWTTNNDSIAVVSNALSSPGEVSALTEGSAQISANYGGLSSATTSITVSDSDPESTNTVGTGLLASYYSGNNFDTLAGQRIDSLLNFNWAGGQAPLGVGDYFSVRWTGQIQGKTTGDCTIASRSDDGFRVYIDGNLLIDVWFPHAPRWDYAYTVPFVAGEKQSITVEFFENGGQAVAELYWQCDGDAGLENIPTRYLYQN